jgi:hypothetical protein
MLPPFSTIKMVAACSSKTPAYNQKTTWHNIPEDNKQNVHLKIMAQFVWVGDKGVYLLHWSFSDLAQNCTLKPVLRKQCS